MKQIMMTSQVRSEKVILIIEKTGYFYSQSQTPDVGH